MEQVTVQTTELITKAEGAGTLGRWLLRIGVGIVTLAGWIGKAGEMLIGRLRK